jgi:molecular chaperone GrpE (heat shock protein)
MAGDEEDRSLTNDPGVAAPQEETGDSETKTEDKGSRFDNAKAFFRALNAGAEVTPTEFGINVGEPPGSGPGERGGGPCMNCKALEDARVTAEAKATEHEKLYKRMAADFENYKKRIDREREEFQDLGVQKTLKEILPALDDLDRAVSHFDDNSDPKTVLESLTLVYNRFLKHFEQLGVKPLQVVGQAFDPRMHEPVQQVETNDIPEGHVASELRRGYSYKDKVVRPSLVNVATPVTVHAAAAHAPAAEPAPEAEEPTYEQAAEAAEPVAGQPEEWIEDATEAGEPQNQEEIHEPEAVREEGEEASETVV